MAELNEELIAKFIDQMAGFQSELQALKTSQQTQADQISAQVAKQVAQIAGALQSDLSSRMVVKDDIDVKADESMRSDTALGFGGRVFKHNIYDLGQAKEILTASQQLSMHQANLNAATVKLVNGSIDAYLAGAQLNSRYANAKWQQELRHADIAAENQWESTQETANDALAGEIAKSVQVPPAVTEE